MAVRQESSKPTQKVAAGALAAAIVTVVMWVINTWALLPGGVILPAEIGAATTTIVGAFVAYIIPPAPRDQVEEKPQTPVDQENLTPQP